MNVLRIIVRPILPARLVAPAGLVRKASMASKASDWETSRYLKFGNERTRPACDLLAQIPLRSPMRVVDLGCGPGNSTELLAARYRSAKLSGMDSSPNMLDQARKVLPDVAFELGDLRTYTPSEAVDLFYSNAVFQWLTLEERIPAIKRLLEFQPKGGVFAMQVPDNAAEPSHVCMREVASEPPFSSIYGSKLPGNERFLPPTQLYDALKPMCESVHIWHTHYQHRLENHEAIVEWLRSTGLRPFLEPLNEKQKKDFLKRYLERIRPEYPVLVDDGVLLRFPRLFVVLVK